MVMLGKWRVWYILFRIGVCFTRRRKGAGFQIGVCFSRRRKGAGSSLLHSLPEQDFICQLDLISSVAWTLLRVRTKGFPWPSVSARILPNQTGLNFSLRGSCEACTIHLCTYTLFLDEVGVDYDTCFILLMFSLSLNGHKSVSQSCLPSPVVLFTSPPDVLLWTERCRAICLLLPVTLLCHSQSATFLTILIPYCLGSLPIHWSSLYFREVQKVFVLGKWDFDN